MLNFVDHYFILHRACANYSLIEEEIVARALIEAMVSLSIKVVDVTTLVVVGDRDGQ